MSGNGGRTAARLALVAAVVMAMPGIPTQAVYAQGIFSLERDKFVVTTDCGATAVVLPLASASTSLIVPDGDRVVPTRVVGVDAATADELASFFTAVIDDDGRGLIVAIGAPTDEGENSVDAVDGEYDNSTPAGAERADDEPHSSADVGAIDEINEQDDCHRRLPDPGTYTIAIDVAYENVDLAASDSSTTAATTIFASIELTAATLSGSTKLEIEQGVFCPMGFCLSDIYAPVGTISVQESSRSATAFEVRVGSTLDPTSESGESHVSAAFAEGAIILKRGEQRDVAIEIGGKVGDVGDTKATIRIVSDTAIAPMEVALTVTRRQNYVTFLVVVMLGLAFGLVVRIGFTRVIFEGERRRVADDALDDLQRVIDNATDKELVGALVAARKELHETLEAAKTMDAVTLAVTTVRSAVADTLRAHGARLLQAANARDIFSARIRSEGRFTEVIGDDLKTANEEIAKIDQLLNEQNATSAFRLIALQQADLHERTTTSAQRWSERVRDSVNNITARSCHDRLPSRIRQALEPHIKVLNQRLDALAAKTANLSELQNVLQAAIVNLRTLIGILSVLIAEIEEAHAVLVQHWSFPTNDQVVAAVTTDLVDKDTATKFEASVRAACDASREIGTYLKDPLQLDRINKEHLAPYMKAVEEGEYAGISELARSGQIINRVLGEHPDKSLPIEPAAVTSGSSEPAPIAEFSGSAIPPAFPGPSIGVTKLVRVVRWFLMAAVVAFGSGVVLPEIMVGTNVQLIGVFFWAFSLDLAYVGLARTAQGLANGPKIA